VLLARLQREAERRPAVRILRHADETARHRARVGLVGGEEGRVRSAQPHRHAEALRRADGDVRAELAWRNE
jgi:hypothetical protein